MDTCLRFTHLICQSLVFLAGCLALGISSASALPRIPHVTFIGPVRSPLVRHLAGFGPIVHSRDPLANFLVVDGDAYSGTMAEQRLLRKAWNAGKALLILDADEGDLEEDLIRLTGFVPSQRVAAVYLRTRRDGGVDQIQLDVKARKLDPAGRRARQEFLRQVGKAFREELPVHPIHRRTPAGDQGAKAISSDFQIGPFLITKVDTQPISGTISGLFSTTSVPQENATLSLNDQITVLGSGSFGGRTTATAYITFQGNDSSSVESFDTFGLGFLSGGDVSGYANPQHQRVVGLTLDQGTPVLVSSQPENTANQATVSSGFNFQIGVSPAGPNANYTYSASKLEQIAGWTITETSDPGGDALQWTYQEQLDANNHDMSDIYSNLFASNNYTIGIGGNYTPSSLAAGLVQSTPMVVWSTTESDGSQQATVTSQLTAANTFWIYVDPLLDPSAVTWSLGSSDSPTLTVSTEASAVISLTDLWNQMGYLTSVSVPTTVSGGDQVPVTVTLDHPAPFGRHAPHPYLVRARHHPWSEPTGSKRQ